MRAWACVCAWVHARVRVLLAERRVCTHVRTCTHGVRHCVAARALAHHPPTAQTKPKQFHTHTNLARADHCATHSSTRHATLSVCSAISLRSRHRFDVRLCWWSPRSIEGATGGMAVRQHPRH